MPPVDDAPDRFNYDWQQHPIWRTRYPSWVIGSDRWLEYSEQLNGTSGNLLIDYLPELSQRTLMDISGRCPRVFISHCQADGAGALRVGQLVQQCGYDYWLRH